MKELKFIVQESNNTPHHTVTIRKEKNNLSAHCTCESGGRDTLCQHRLSILAGKAKWVISDNGADVKRVINWLAWTDVGLAINEVTQTQKQLKAAGKELEAATERLKEAEKAAAEARTKLIEAMND
ncbi:MAG: hypothetical protein HQL80_12775 [Magnetococcales bacterium]|nr:hypothetical protein [Magnetococcales bacterium]